jgi:hypothetical protein
MLSPMATGFVLGKYGNTWISWDILFYTFGGMVLVSNVFFLIWASAERQWFDLTEEEKSLRRRSEPRYSSIN